MVDDNAGGQLVVVTTREPWTPAAFAQFLADLLEENQDGEDNPILIEVMAPGAGLVAKVAGGDLKVTVEWLE